MEANVLDMKGKKIDTVELPGEIFAAPVNVDMMHQAFVRQQANARLGTHKTKSRGEVQLSTRKIYRQKGTGRARRGDIKSPLMRGGGVIFGPHPRSFKSKVSKKVRKLALKMALTSKLQENELVVLDRFELEKVKTKDFIEIVQALRLDNALIVTDKKDETLELSSRNVPRIKVLRSEGLNVYDILKYKNLVLLEPAINDIEGRLLA